MTGRHPAMYGKFSKAPDQLPTLQTCCAHSALAETYLIQRDCQAHRAARIFHAIAAELARRVGGQARCELWTQSVNTHANYSSSVAKTFQREVN